MPNGSPLQQSRRDILAGVASVAACAIPWAKSAIARRSVAPHIYCSGGVPTSKGPDAELYGAAEGYPVPEASLARRQGNPWEPKYRVGAFSHLDDIYATRRISRARVPWEFKRSTAEVRYRFQGRQSSLTDYVSRNPVTGLLIARGDQILFEH